ncbi:F-box protein At2g26160-like [Rhodamnia argentea]|uniref:F-box protein At2g26160-like n=1 Tax=Rhodamnia argentea TaxID=178133 RepID=A0A8B8N8A8_9MYRT|nr:F-box protein At2g26160-like [Rhodamnia argentea]XP_030535891.1 F-box protein At2g26160-like [Rhodamnia argentea]XP_048139623.1 F-box protein At2g26160-like [Rhodamnia argentea]
MEGIRKRPWSDLPPELLSMIGSRLQTRMDVLRFRSVCSSFRSSIAPPAPRLPFQVPSARRLDLDLFLHERTVYALKTPADKAASGREWRLLKLEEAELGDMLIFGLFSRRLPLGSLPRKFPEVLDSLQFRVEICREYTLQYRHGCTQGLKVVVHPDCALDQRVVYFIDLERQLWYWKHGDENWSHLGCGYEDIEVYQGKVWAVDVSGLVSQIDSSFTLGNFSRLPIGNDSDPCFHRKRLVVSNDDLYAVDRHFVPRRSWRRDLSDFRACKLDQQCGRWEEVRSLGNSAFFLCNLCSFAIPVRELGWCPGDCIYYAGSTFTNHLTGGTRAFSLADRKPRFVDFSRFFD